MEAVLKLNQVSQPIYLDLDFEEFKAVLDHRLAWKVKNFGQLVLKFFRRLNRNHIEQLNNLCEEDDTLREQLQNQLNLPETLEVEFKHGEQTSQSFAVAVPEVQAETLQQIKLFDSFKLRLRRHHRRVFSFCEPQELEAAPQFNFLKHGKKFLNISLGVIAFVSATQGVTMKDSFPLAFPSFSFSSAPNSQATALSLEELSQQFLATEDPALKAIGQQMLNLNFKKLTAAPALPVLNEDDHYHEITPEDAHRIEAAITSFYKNINPARLQKIQADIPVITAAIIKTSKAKDLDYKLLMSIMKVESDFTQGAVNANADFSVAQINYGIWSKELYKERKIKLNKDKLKKDIDYSVSMMGEILQIIRHRHQSDPLWYARYHNSKPSLKVKYANKVHSAREQIDHAEVKIFLSQVNGLIKQLAKLDFNNLAVKVDETQVQTLIAQLKYAATDVEKSQLKNQIASR